MGLKCTDRQSCTEMLQDEHGRVPLPGRSMDIRLILANEVCTVQFFRKLREYPCRCTVLESFIHVG